MDLFGAFEEGNIFKPDVLDIDTDVFIGNMRTASGNAFGLAIEIGWATKQTIEPLIMKARNNALALALEQGIINKETIENLISKANNQMLALKNKTSS